MQELDKNIAAQIDTLKDEVRKMLLSETDKPLAKVNLIDSICRLGVSYHFENEIEDVLQDIHKCYVENGEIILDDNLCSLALLFRVLRQQGFHVSPSIYLSIPQTITFVHFFLINCSSSYYNK
jgi:(-)-germacrene D synthase